MFFSFIHRVLQAMPSITKSFFLPLRRNFVGRSSMLSCNHDKIVTIGAEI